MSMIKTDSGSVCRDTSSPLVLPSGDGKSKDIVFCSGHVREEYTPLAKNVSSLSLVLPPGDGKLLPLPTVFKLGHYLKTTLLCLLICMVLLPGVGAAAAQDDTKLMEALRLSSEAYEKKDYARVKSLLAPWAEKNEPTAAFVLGLMLARGEGDPKNLNAAEKWWIRAADAGNPLAQFNLGYIYFKGAVGAQDYAKAREYWTLAAKQGQPDALYGLGVLQISGEGGSKDIPNGIINFKAAADKGHPMAQYELGQAYLKGMGVKQDKKKARELFSKASASGMPEAKAALEDMGGKAADKPAKKPAPKTPAKKKQNLKLGSGSVCRDTSSPDGKTKGFVFCSGHVREA